MIGFCVAAKLMGFAMSHRPVTVDLSPAFACNTSGQEYGPGVKRMDPGTVNLPLWVGTCPPPARVTIWFPRR